MPLSRYCGEWYRGLRPVGSRLICFILFRNNYTFKTYQIYALTLECKTENVQACDVLLNSLKYDSKVTEEVKYGYGL